jgi:hypothetical protein
MAASHCRERGWLVSNVSTLDVAEAPLVALAEILRQQPDLERKELARMIEQFVARRGRLEERVPIEDRDLEMLRPLQMAMGTDEWAQLKAAIETGRYSLFERELLRLLWLFDMRSDAKGLEYGVETLIEATSENPWFAQALASTIQLYGVLWGHTDEWARLQEFPRKLLRKFFAEMLFVHAHFDARFGHTRRIYMLSISNPTSGSEESDVTTAVPAQGDRPENMAGSLVGDTRAEAPVEDEDAPNDVARPAAANHDCDRVIAASPAAPDAESLVARLQVLLGAVLEVEQFSRRAREAAASDLARYDALVTTHQVLEHHQREATGIRKRDTRRNASVPFAVIRLPGARSGQCLVDFEQPGPRRGRLVVASSDPAQARRWAGSGRCPPLLGREHPAGGSSVRDRAAGRGRRRGARLLLSPRAGLGHPARKFAVTAYAFGSSGSCTSCAPCAERHRAWRLGGAGGTRLRRQSTAGRRRSVRALRPRAGY